MTAAHKDDLLKHSILVLGATQIANVSNLLFQMIMGRSLSDVQYGVLSAMLGVILLVATPLTALRTAMAHFTSRLAREERFEDIRLLVNRWTKDLVWIAIPIVGIGVLGSGPIARFFRMEVPGPVMITSIVLAGVLFMQLCAGILQGLQVFPWMAASLHAWAVIRMLVAWLLVSLVCRAAEAGLVAHAVGLLVSVCVGFLGLHRFLHRSSSADHKIGGVHLYFARSMIILTAYAVLMNGDILMVKHYFESDVAGRFAWAATIGRTAMFIAVPLALVMFPKVASGGKTSDQDWRTLWKAFLYAGSAIAGIMLICTVVPQLPLYVLFGRKAMTPETMRLLRVIVWAMCPLGILFLVMNFELAQHRFRWSLWFLVVAAAGYILGVARWHASVYQVAVVLAVVNVTALLVLIAGLPWRTHGGEAVPESGE